MSSSVSTARAEGSRSAARARPDGAVEIAEIWLILWHRRVMILAAAAVLVAATVLYGLLTPALFTASAQILVDPRDRIVVSNDVNPNALSPDGGVAQVESQSSVLRSTGVLVRAIRSVRLAEDAEFSDRSIVSRLLDMVRTRPESTTDGLTPPEGRALDRLRKAVAVKRADKTLVLEIIVTTKGAAKSALIANAVAEAYLADQAEARSRNAREASSAITSRLAELRKRVDDAENAVERYRVENNLVTTSGRPITDQQLGDISTQYAGVQARIATLRAQVEQLARRNDGSLEGSSLEATQSAVIAKLREQEATLMQRDADLQTQFGPLHPSVQASRNQLNNVRRLIATEIRRVEQTARAELDRALGNERQLAAKLESLTRLNQGTDQATVRLRDLQRDLEAARSLYSSFLLRAQETREQATLDTTNARIISRALPPTQASWPPLLALVAGAAFIGLGCGAGFALVREYAAPHLLSVSQSEAVLEVPVAGMFREWPGEQNGKNDIPPGYRANLDAAGLTLANLLGRTTHRRRRADTVLLVSTEPDAGRRALAARLLADAAAERGDIVLFVDGNLAPSQQRRAGLMEVLRGDCSLRAAIGSGQPDEIAVLAGGLPPGPLRGMPRGAALRFLDDADRDFDLVVIDAGELGRNMAIGSLLGAVDHVLLVAKLTETLQADAMRLAETTGVMGGDVTATILFRP